MSDQEPAKDSQDDDSEFVDDDLAHHEDVPTESADLNDLGGLDLETAYLKALTLQLD